MTTVQSAGEARFWKVRVDRVADKVEAQLRQLIADGALKVGDRLPSERELAARMGISRVSVRQAIQRLGLQGILETVHGGGSIVRNLTEQEIRRPIERFIQEDRRRVMELVELRAFLETWAAHEAARHRTAQELEAIAAYIGRMARGLGKGKTDFELDFKLHMEIASATHNAIYIHLIDNIHHLIRYSIKVHHEEVFCSREDQVRLLAQHRRILQAIRDRKPEAAAAAMKEHQAFVVAEYTRRFGPA